MTREKLIDIETLPDNPTVPDRLGALFRYFVLQAKWTWLLVCVVNGALAVMGALTSFYVGVIVDVFAGDEGMDALIPPLSILLGILFILIFAQILEAYLSAI